MTKLIHDQSDTRHLLKKKRQNAPCTKTGEETGDTKLTAHLDQPASDSLTRECFCLVYLGQQGIGRLGYDSSSETGNKTRRKVE